jgi:hypothetical protein
MVRECPNIRCRNCEENHFSKECPYMYDDQQPQISAGMMGESGNVQIIV